jgi:PAS domain S-box-containing protein
MTIETESVTGVEKEERFSRIFQFLPDAVLVARAEDSVVLEINEAFEALTGYAPDAILGRSSLGLVFFLDPELWTRVRHEIDATGEVRGLETKLLRKDGRIAFVRMSMRRLEIDGVFCDLTTIQDISGRGMLEDEKRRGIGEALSGPEIPPLPDMDMNREEIARLIDIQALQDLMNSFYMVTRIGMAITDVNGNVQVSAGWQDICTRFHRIHPETLANCRESDISLTTGIKEGEYSLYKCKNGMWDMASPIMVGGRHIANLFLGQFLFDDEKPDYEFFRQQARKCGFDTEEYLAALDRVPRWSRELVHHVMGFYTKLAMLVSRLSIGNIRMSRALAEQKKVEHELLLHKFCIDNAGIGIFQTFEQTIYNANDFVCKSLGYTADELRAMTVFDIDPVITMDRMREIREMLEATGSVTHQTMHRRKDGTVLPVEITTNQVEFNGKRYAISFVKDITDRKLAEEALRESEEKFRVLSETSPAAIALYQGEDVIYINPTAAGLIGYSVEELSRISFWGCVHEDFREMVRERGIARMRGDAVPNQYECKFVTKDGRELWAIISVGLIEFKGRPAGIVTLIDRTEAKAAEERIRASLAEKEVLLKEVHHRVKNNLQIISSLLDLQSDYIQEEYSRRYIGECQDRIRSLALVHEQLYKSVDLSVIDFASYTDELVASLCRSLVADQERVRVKVEMQDIELGIDEAIPCGLIINELVSNSLKHAFPGDRQGEILVQGVREGSGVICLSVTDTGIGLPPGFDFFTTETLGLQIVDLLSRQLHGRVEMRGDRGSTVTLRFPVKG